MCVCARVGGRGRGKGVSEGGRRVGKLLLKNCATGLEGFSD